jgi:hypothetical protein
VANAPFALIPRLTGARVALNVDGLEWQRGKWGPLGRAYYRFCSWLAPKLPIVLVSDGPGHRRLLSRALPKGDRLHPLRHRRAPTRSRGQPSSVPNRWLLAACGRPWRGSRRRS